MKPGAALAALTDWLGSPSSIVCEPRDRLEMLTIWCLRTAGTIEFGIYTQYTESIENGMLWIRPC